MPRHHATLYVCICWGYFCHGCLTSSLLLLVLLLVVLLEGLAVGRNDYRDARKQRNLILDHGLDACLVAAAKAAGVSVNEFVTRLIEEAVNVGERDGRGDRGRTAEAVVGVGAPGGRDRGGDSERVPAAGGPVNWDALLEQGRAAKLARVVEVPMFAEPDPLDVIA